MRATPDGVTVSMTKTKPDPNPLHLSGNNEWYTPPEVVQFVKGLLGIEQFALDPASSPLANAIVGAERFYTQADDGLSRSWGNPGEFWFCNPPYGGGTGKWIDKAIEEEAPGVMLINAVPGRKWFQRALAADLECYGAYFFSDRIKFLDPRNNMEPAGSPGHDNTLLFFRCAPCFFGDFPALPGFYVSTRDTEFFPCE